MNQHPTWKSESPDEASYPNSFTAKFIIHNSSLIDPTLCQLNPLHTLKHFILVNFSVMVSLKPMSLKSLFP